MKHVAPPIGESVELDLLTAAVDAYSMSPAIRLRYRVLAEKTSVRPPLAALPPPVEHLTEHTGWRQDEYERHTGVLATLARLRQEAADTIEHLIAFLDESDGIADAEDTDEDGDLSGSPDAREEDGADDEPILGSVELHPNGHYDLSDHMRRPYSQEHWAAGNLDDREGDEHDGREPEHEDYDGKCDAEPSLGSANDYNGNGASYAIAGDDREGPDEDLEPSLCGVEVTCSLGNDRDLEADDADQDDDVEREPELGWTISGAIGDPRHLELNGEFD